MANFSKTSARRLYTCHELLRILFFQVVADFDCKVLEGHRGKTKQNRYYKEGRSKVKFPDGKHNKKPSEAVDVVPYPIVFPDKENPTTYLKDVGRYYYFAGYVKGMAKKLGIKIRWGGDWDSDYEILDNTFDDLVHFELII